MEYCFWNNVSANGTWLCNLTVLCSSVRFRKVSEFTPHNLLPKSLLLSYTNVMLLYFNYRNSKQAHKQIFRKIYIKQSFLVDLQGTNYINQPTTSIHQLHQSTNQLSAFHQLVWKNTNQVDEKINQFKVWKELLQPWMCKSLKSLYISYNAFLALWVFFSCYTCL